MDIVMPNTVIYKNGCPETKASIHMIKKFAEKAHIDDLYGLEDALARGNVFAWETGWIGYEILERGDDRIFWILSIFNDTNAGKYSTATKGKWFWKKFKELAKDNKCNKMKFQTRRYGMTKWAGQFGFKIEKFTMERDL